MSVLIEDAYPHLYTQTHYYQSGSSCDLVPTNLIKMWIMVNNLYQFFSKIKWNSNINDQLMITIL